MSASSSLSRRGFFAAAGTAAVMAGIPASAAAQSTEAAPGSLAYEWDADVLVVGAGIAGLSAAIFAADAGAKVILLDKMPDGTSSATWKSGGNFGGAGTKMQIAAGIMDSPSMMYNEFMQISRLQAKSEMLKVHCEQAGLCADLLDEWSFELFGESIFLNHAPTVSVHEAYSVDRVYLAMRRPEYQAPAGGGSSIQLVLEDQLQKRIARGAVTAQYNTRALELIVDEGAGRVVGCKVEGEDGEADIYAKTVILATGGFMSSPEALAEFTPYQSSALSTGAESSTGDGLFMATAIGANVYGMDMDYGLPYPGTIPDPDRPGRGETTFDLHTAGIVWVDKHGVRFAAEDTENERDQKVATLQAEDQQVYVIFDEAVREANGATVSVWAEGALDSDRFLEEAERGVFVKKADTLEELAAALGIPGDALVETIERYNTMVEAGEDTDFGRQELEHKIETPPFYGIMTVPRNLSTKGGLLINADGKVINTEGSIIPGLYAAGEVAAYALLVGYGMAGGSLLAHCMVMGKITARNAALEAKTYTVLGA
ncbi:MAG: FAD-dependent oxidoreductase [Anaerolineae bacterium]|jgi:fumarate reductase flavoprotein subunit